MKKVAASLARTRTVAELLPNSNREDGAISIGVGPGKKYEEDLEFMRDRQCEETNITVKIKEDAKERKLL